MNLEAALAADGWMHNDELAWLAARAQEARSIIEVGCWKGKSTLALADNTPGRVYAVDHWNGSAGDPHCEELRRRGPDCIFEDFQRNMGPRIAAGRVRPMRMESKVAAWQFQPVSADFVFLDGDHRYDGVRQDIDLYAALVKPGGILAGHDYGIREHPGVKRAVDERFPAAQFHLSIWWVGL